MSVISGQGYALGDPFPLSAQLGDTLRGFAVAFEVSVVAFFEFALVLAFLAFS
jgi:hypothetical protein